MGRPPRGGDSPGLVVKQQPMPLEVRVCRVKVGARWISALWRSWAYDDVRDCRLCPKGTCSAVGGTCLLLVCERIEDRDAPLYEIKVPPERTAPS
jgi:hypothetical protein